MFKTLELPGGFAPLAPLPGLCPGPTGSLKRPPDPSPNNFAPPISNPWLRPWLYVHCLGFNLMFKPVCVLSPPPPTYMSYYLPYLNFNPALGFVGLVLPLLKPPPLPPLSPLSPPAFLLRAVPFFSPPPPTPPPPPSL